MGFAWNWLALPGFLGAALALALLPLVLRRPRSRASLLVALILAAQVVSGACGFGLAYLSDDRTLVYNLVLLTQAAHALALPASLLILGELPLPALRWLRSRAAVAVAMATGAGVAAGAFLAPRAYAQQLVPTGYAPWIVVPGPVAVTLATSSIVLLGVALALSLVALRRAPRATPARERAWGFLAAFGFRNVLSIFLVLVFFVLPASETREQAAIVAGGLGHALFVVLLAYAILRTKLFDIDLHVKLGLKRTSLAAAFVAAFFVVSELSSALLSESMGTIAGVLAAGALVFALAPLQRMADRVASAAMPRVEATPAYVAYRKMQVYRAALEEALANGDVSPRERRMLERLRAELDLAEPDVAALEAALAQAAPAKG